MGPDVTTRPDPLVEVQPDAGALATAVAGELLARLADAQRDGREPQVVLTGGSIAARVWADGDEAWLVVTDTGIGIPAEEQDALFQKFFRASTAQAMAIQGTGLGLSIVAGIVAAHGGRIGVESAADAGSSFTVRLPLRRD